MSRIRKTKQMFSWIPLPLAVLAIGLALTFVYSPTDSASAQTQGENELSVSERVLSCNTTEATVSYLDIQEAGGPVDKVLSIFIDEDGDGSFPTSPSTVIDIPDTAANESDTKIFQTILEPGQNLRARLRVDVSEGLGELIDEDILSTADPVPCLGSVTVILDTDPEDNGPWVDFDSDLGDFDLRDRNSDRSEIFISLANGDYDFTVNPPAGWEVSLIDCDITFAGLIAGHESDWDENSTARTFEVDLRDAEDIECTVTIRPVPTPTATATSVVTATNTAVPTNTPVPSTSAAPVSPVTVNVNQVQEAPTQPVIIPTAPPAPISTAAPSGRITAPNTGDGGLLN